MSFILSAIVSTLCSLALTRLVTLAADDFTGALHGPYEAAGKREIGQRGDDAPMYFIGLFVTGLFFAPCVQNHWLRLSYGAGLLGPFVTLAFICALAVGYRAFQWSEHYVRRLYRDRLNSLRFVDRAYAAARRRVK